MSGSFTYSEWALRMDQTGRVAPLINLMSQYNGIYYNLMATPCQSANSYEFVQIVALPTPVRRQYNQGVAPTTGKVAPQVQRAVQYADTVRIDVSLARLNGNLGQLRTDEDKLHLEALSQKIASDIFYSNPAGDATQFQGLFQVYNTVNSAVSAIASNVLDCGGTSNCASMFLLGSGSRHIHSIFSNGLPAGMIHEDKGQQQTPDANNLIYWAWTTWIEQNFGMAVEDYRYGVRAANIDVTLFGGGSAANLINILSAMVHIPPVMLSGVAPVQNSDDPERVSMARNCICMNRTLLLALDQQAQNKNNVLLRMEQWAGRAVTTYRDIPLECVDAMVNSESRVV